MLARSIFNHSMNYRSVVVLGTAGAVLEPKEKLEALRSLSEHIIHGRWSDSRLPNERELKQTLVLRLPIEEFSSKVRQGPAIDDEEDYSIPHLGGSDSVKNDCGRARKRSAARSQDAGTGVCQRVFAEEVESGRWLLVGGQKWSLVLGRWSLAKIKIGIHRRSVVRSSFKNKLTFRVNSVRSVAARF